MPKRDPGAPQNPNESSRPAWKPHGQREVGATTNAPREIQEPKTREKLNQQNIKQHESDRPQAPEGTKFGS